MATASPSSLPSRHSGGGSVSGDVGRRASSYHAAASLSPDARQGTFSPATPDAQRKRRSLNLPSSDATLASSPILNSSHLSPPDQGRSGGSARNSNVSSVSSARFSRDLDDIRWELSSQRDDAEEPMRRSRGVSESDGEGSQNGDVTYSALSKRADFILANAKRKLTLLEGNLGRARHSLIVSPTSLSDLNRSDSNASVSSAPSPTANSPRTSSDERTPIRGPKINFGTPRQTFNRFQGGHSRVYSDSTVPSTQGNTTVGSRSYEFRRAPDFGKRHPLHKSTPDQALDSVPENPPSPSKHHGHLGSRPSSKRSSRDSSHSRAYTPIADSDSSSLTGMVAKLDTSNWAQAEKLRNRISNIQQRSREASRQRSSPMTLVEEDDEEAAAANAGTTDPASELHEKDERASLMGGDVERGDSRLEWRQVLESGKTGPGSAGSYLEEDEFDFEEEEEEEEEEEDYDDDEEDQDHEFPEDNPEVLQGAHEDRSDAFDYEHFILHSIMGNHPEPEDFVSDSEGSAAATERGLHDDAAGSDADDEDGAAIKDTASQTSFHTAHSDEDRILQSEDEQGVPMESWPVPPTGRNGETTKANGKSAKAVRRRPESDIVSRVLVAGETSAGAGAADLASEDRELFYAVATSFRTVCTRLQAAELGKHDQVDLRQRLEIARRVLDGDL